MNRILSILFILTLFASPALSENKKPWTAQPDYAKAFIENKGQFNGRNKKPESNIMYAIDHGPYQVYFTRTGITYRLDKKLPRKKWDKTQPIQSEEHWKSIMDMRKQVNMVSDIIHIDWTDCNPNTEIIATDARPDYFSYAMGNNNTNYNQVKGFARLTYKNIYEKIDLEYEFHEKEGFKYAFILHPGADPSMIKMKFSESAKVTKDDEGNIKIQTQFGEITDHAPVTFYSEKRSDIIGSTFKLTGNELSFRLADYDRSKKVILDPWTVFPTSPNSNKVWEVETDNAGNVYAYMGDMPITLRKYNPAGALQWTYLTPWDSSGYWIGGMITHPSGESYITSGSNGEIRKISTTGSQLWFNNPNALTSYEYWSLAFNCDLTKLVIGGTRLQFSIPTPILRGTVMQINLANGAITQTVIVGFGNVIGIPPNIQEVSSICSAPNGNYYFLTLDTVGAIKDDLTSIAFKTQTSYNFDYYIPGYGFGTKQPISAIRATPTHFFTHNGIEIHKRDLLTGAVIANASIPSGISNTSFFGTKTQGNGGLDVDSCGNVYVGSGNGVYKFDSNLNLVASATTPGPVYDVDVSNSGEVAASGNNFVATVSLSSCNVPTAICVTTMLAAASSTNSACASQCSGTATANPIGGSAPYTYQWSNGQNTQNISNLCAGTYTVTITDVASLTATATVTVTEPLPLNSTTTASNASCGQSNGSATVSVSGGTSPYNYVWSPGGATGATVNGISAGSYSVSITDANGCTLTDTINVNTTGGPNVTVFSITDVTCNGDNDGAASISASAGTPPYTYLWSTSPPQTTSTAAGLSAGIYSVSVTDSFGCVSNLTVVISQPTPITTLSTVNSNDLCGLGNGSATVSASGGSPGYTYSWSTTPPQTTNTVNNLTGGTYTVIVTDLEGCTVTDTITIATLPGLSLSVTSQTNADCNGNGTGSATVSSSQGTAPFTYNWSTTPAQSTASATGLSAGTYTATVTDANGCSSTIDVTITEPPALALTSSATSSSCGLSNGSATVNVSGGTPSYSYSWNTAPVQTGQTATALAPGSYAVTVTDASGCSSISSVTVQNIPTFTTSSATVPGCGSETGSVSVSTSGGIAPFTYLWSPGGGNNPTVNNLSSGTYNCTITDATGCIETISITLTNFDLPAADAGVDVTIEEGSSIQLNANGGQSYSWLPAGGLSCTDCQSPVAAPSVTTTYCVSVTDNNGCADTACVKVIVDVVCGEVYVPNAFTPDGATDPENEKQCVYGKCIQSMEFAVYTRWGQKVFETTDQKKCWDGTFKGEKLNTGVYVYYLKATLTDGTTISRKGDVSLIR